MSAPEGWYIQEPYVGTFSTREPGFEGLTNGLLMLGMLGALSCGFMTLVPGLIAGDGLAMAAVSALIGFGSLGVGIVRLMRQDVEFTISFNNTGIRFAGAGVDRMYRWNEVMAVGILTNRGLAVRLHAPTESVRATSGGIFWSLVGFSANWDVVVTAPMYPVDISRLVVALRTFAGNRYRGSHMFVDQVV